MAIILKANKVNLFVSSVLFFFLVPFTELFRHTPYKELVVKPEILTSYIHMDLCLATLKSGSFYLPHNVSTLNQSRNYSVALLCVNTLLANKVTLITGGI
jgi:hypothetical protein